MTDETIPGIRPLTVQQIGDHVFQQLTAGDFKCPVCSRQDFVLAYMDGPGGSVAPYQLVASLSPLQSFATTPLVCENCGFVSLFSHKVIGDKLPK